MKKIVTWLMAGIFGLSLAACGTPAKKEYRSTKCPACGYEFSAPAKN